MEATQGGDDNGLDVAILAIGDFQIFRRFFIGSVIRVLVTVVFVGRNGGVGNGIDGTHVKNGAVGVVSEKHKAVGLLSVCLFAGCVHRGIPLWRFLGVEFEEGAHLEELGQDFVVHAVAA